MLVWLRKVRTSETWKGLSDLSVFAWVLPLLISAATAFAAWLHREPLHKIILYSCGVAALSTFTAYHWEKYKTHRRQKVVQSPAPGANAVAATEDSWLHWFNERRRVQDELDVLEAKPEPPEPTNPDAPRPSFMDLANQQVRRMTQGEIYQQNQRNRKMERQEQEIKRKKEDLKLIEARLNAFDIADVGKMLGARERAELSRERLGLEDEIAVKRAELKYEEAAEQRAKESPLYYLQQMGNPHAPRKTILLREEIERREKLIAEIDRKLGRGPMPRPPRSP
jgi:hypothetical protein